MLAAILTVTASLQSLAMIENSPGAPVEIAEESHSPEWTIPEGTYLFKFKWNGIPSAEGRLDVSTEIEDGIPSYLFEGSARTSKFADMFWKFRATVVAVVEAVSGRAKKINTTEQERSKLKETETVLDYHAGEAQYVRWKKGQKKEKTISLEGGILDLASLGVMLAQRPLQVGDSDSLTVLFKDDQYALDYEVLSRERVSAAGKKYDALRVEPKFMKITDEKRMPKIRQMTVWVTESAPHIPLRMRSKTFVGHVTGELQKIASKESEDG
jgi:hypothetical protein